MIVADRRRALQLALAGLWLLDAALQCQPVMFTRAFGQMLAASATGNIAVIAVPIIWNARIVEQHAVVLNATFATIQLLLAAGIAWRRSTRIALAASIAWAVAVWWLGEGFGGLFAGDVSPVDGAPGAAILYALLAVLLWPADRSDRASTPAPFIAARTVGARTARRMWLTLWAILASVALWPQNRAPEGLTSLVLSAASGEPGWLTAVNRHAAALLVLRGLAASAALAAVLALIAAGPYLPAPAARCVVVLAIVVATAIWVIGEMFGGILAGNATDPNTGAPLVLLALAFWPASPRPEAPPPQGSVPIAVAWAPADPMR